MRLSALRSLCLSTASEMAWATPELLPWKTKWMPSPITFLSWIRLSCGLTLLSKGTISICRPRTTPARLMASAAKRNCLRPFSPVAANGPESGST